MPAAAVTDRPAIPVDVALPEPPANRAQTIPGSILQRWLARVIQRDLDGYALIAGQGHTVALLYGDGRPLRSAVTRGASSNPGDVLVRIQSDRDEACFVMTYKFPERSGKLFSGLFLPPSGAIRFAPEHTPVIDKVVASLPPGFNGAVVVRNEEIAWSVIVLSDGMPVACYGADDRNLGYSTTALGHLDLVEHLEVAVHPSSDEGAQASETHNDATDSGQTPMVEGRMIELLSLFEHRLSRFQQEVIDPSSLARALAEVCDAAGSLDLSASSVQVATVPRHPVLAAHWDQSKNALSTERLLSTLEMAGIPDAWVNAADALLVAIDRAVELQLTWLAVEDELAASTLREALDDLLQQGRSLLKAWRSQRSWAGRPEGTKQLAVFT